MPDSEPSLVADSAAAADGLMKKFFAFASGLTAISYLSQFVPSLLQATPVVGPVAATVNAVNSVANSVIGVATGPWWNFWDSGFGVVTSLPDMAAANKSKINGKMKATFALANAFWSSIGMPGLTSWGAGEMIRSLVTHLNKAGIVSGAAFAVSPVAMTTGSFAFAGAMFICAAQSGWQWHKASEKTDPDKLLADRKAKLAKVKAELANLEGSTVSLPGCDLDETARSVFSDSPPLVVSTKNQKKKERLEAAKGILEKQIEALSPATRGASPLAKYLLQKQHDKAAAKRRDTIAWTCAGVGAVFVGLSCLFPPLAVPTLVLGAVAIGFYAYASYLKVQQVKDKNLTKRAREYVAKQGSSNDSNPQKGQEISDQQSENLLREYFKSQGGKDGDFSGFKAGLTPNDIERIVDGQCVAKYKASLPEPAPGLLTRCASAFFSPGRRQCHYNVVDALSEPPPVLQ